MKNRVVSELLNRNPENQFPKVLSEYVLKNTTDTLETNSEAKRRIDPNTRRLMSYFFTGTRGGTNRIRIILLLAQRPLNLHQIAKELVLDYKAIQFHMEILEKNNLVSRAGDHYGTLFFLSAFLEHNIEAFNEIIVKLYKNLNIEYSKGTH